MTDHSVFVGLDLRDGTCLDGPLQSFIPGLDGNDERSIMSGRPVKIFPAETEAVLGWDVDRVVVSAGQIRTISVRYVAVEPDEESEDLAGRPEVARGG